MVRTSASIWVGCHSVGQPVPDRHAGVVGQLLDGGLGEAAELDAVEHPAQHPGGVGDRLLLADVRAVRAQIGDVGALVVGRDLERAPGAGGRFLEDQRDVLAGQPRSLGAGGLVGLERGG